MDAIIQALAFLAALFAAWIPALTFSYNAGIWKPELPRAEIIFGGDMMFDRSIRVAASKKSGDFIFSCIDPVISKSDAVVANLEGPITGSDSVSVGSAVGEADNFKFTFPTSTATLLFRHNVRIVSLGNNHIMNFGASGMRETARYLDEAGVKYFGLPSEALAEEGDPRAQNVAHVSIKGVKLAFINYNQFARDSSPELTIGEIKKARAAGELPVVYTHWGDEYVPPPQRVKDLAHEFVKAGAAIVIGSHPHIVQEHEVYLGKDIYYSLGNLIFDQYWNEAVRRGLLLDVVFSPVGVASVREIPVELEHDRRTCPYQEAR